MANKTETIANTFTLSVQDGLAHIEQGTPLTRLHYFDGKFLRADALTLEQDYHRNLVRMSNLAGGWGVVHGLGIDLAGDQLSVSPGLAITPAGSTVLAGQAFKTPVSDLLKVAQPAPASGNAAFGDCPGDAKVSGTESIGTGIYEITVGPVEGLCGNEAVYGKLCEDACVTDSQRPYWREGLVLRLRPITLTLADSSAVTLTNTHQRNRVASAYFASEPWLTSSLLSASGLAGNVWCNPAQLYGRDEVPIGLLVREGGSTRFIDAWSARRERMDSQARGYWQGRMMMRPWNVFLAQILQFQCQLSGTFSPGTGVFDPMDDDCQKLRALLKDSLRELEVARRKYAMGNQKILQMLGDNAAKEYADALEMLNNPYRNLEALGEKLADVDDSLLALPKNRMLLTTGFMELPPAGYLPVVPGKQPVNTQLERMFGEGVKLHLCTARPDYIPHAVEEAQHMQRISLTRGLDNPQQIEHVEIFVPDGQIVDSLGVQDGTYWLTQVSPLILKALDFIGRQEKNSIDLNKDARDQILNAAGEAMLAKAGGAPATGAPAPEAKLRSKARTKAASTDASATNTIRTNLGGMREAETFAGLARQSLTGLARTSRLDGGGAAITLVCRLEQATQLQRYEQDSSDTQAVMSLLSGNATNNPARAMATPERGVETLPTREIPLALYFDLSIKQDPFAGQEGDEMALGFELRALTSVVDEQGTSARKAGIVRGTGQLSLDEFINLGQGRQAIRATATLDGRMTERQADVGKTRPLQLDLPVVLYRDGSMRAGNFHLMMLGDARAGLHWVADWSGTPRSATLGVQAMAEKDAGMVIGTYLPQYSMKYFSYKEQAATVRPLVELQEVVSVLQPESAVRLAALNTLAQLAEAAGDDAFLARARRRLFPDMDVTEALLVRATLDWVMFRRQRKAQCDHRCVCPAVTTESFQTWHLRLKTAKQLAALQTALDQNDTQALQKFRFQRVDVLHYDDAATSPTETLGQIQSDWQQAQPGKAVALARVWERVPQTGQGWQNHARVKRLISLLDGLVTPPASGAIHALGTAPQPLDDANFDGGMLLVTMDVAAAEQTTHRVFFISAEHQRLLQAEMQHGKEVRLSLEKYALYSQYVHFDQPADTAVAADIAAAKTKLDSIPPMASMGVMVFAKGAAGRNSAIHEYQAICQPLGVTLGATGTQEVYDVADAEFGNGAVAATVVYLVYEIG